jgi:hypothetical protein
LEPGALFASDTRRVESFVMHAPRLLVETFEAAYAEAQLPGLRPQVQTDRREASYELTHVEIRLDPASDPTGWLGLLIENGSMAHVSSGPATFHAQENARIGNGDTGNGDEWHFFVAEAQGPQVVVEAAGDWRVNGSMSVKFSGVDLVLRAQENTSHIQTGWEPVQTVAGEARVRWAILTAKEGVFTFSLPAPVEAFSSSASARWDGRARFDDAAGSLDIGRASASFHDETAHVAGVFQVGLLPILDDDVPRLEAQLAGDVDEASTSSALIHAGAVRAPLWPWLILMGAALIASGAYLHRHHARRARPDVPPLDAEACVDVAARAADVDDFETALSWTRRAKQLSPRSARILMDEAHFLERLGRTDQAATAYAIAQELDATSGEPELSLARLRLRTGAHAADIEPLLVRALERSPILLLEIVDDSSWEVLMTRPVLKDAIKRARKTLE